MDYQSADPVADTIQNICVACQAEGQFEGQRVTDLARSTVDLLNEKELVDPAQMTDRDYCQSLLTHLIALDTTNAKYLWKRIPLKFKDDKVAETKGLRDVWQIGKALSKNDYVEAFRLLSADVFLQDDSLKGLLEALTKVLREEHVLKMVTKAYSVIPYETLKDMLGMQQVQDSQVKAFFESRGMKINDKLVMPPAEDTDRKRFELTEERINNLSQIVQFLEQQKNEATNQ